MSLTNSATPPPLALIVTDKLCYCPPLALIVTDKLCYSPPLALIVTDKLCYSPPLALIVTDKLCYSPPLALIVTDKLCYCPPPLATSTPIIVSGSKNMIGQYTHQFTTKIARIVKLYERDNVYLADSAKQVG